MSFKSSFNQNNGNNFSKAMDNKVLFMSKTALIAALYFVVTLALAPISFGQVQFRLSEILTVLPVLMVEAVPGLTLGCLISNLLNPNNLGAIDIIFGTLATMLAAISTYFIARKYRPKDSSDSFKSSVMNDGSKRSSIWKEIMYDFFAVTPPVVFNALIVGTYLPFLLQESGSPSLFVILTSILLIAFSEAVIIYVLGIPFLNALRRSHLFNKKRYKTHNQ